MTTTTTAIIIMLIVLFGAGLMGKMLKDLYPGTLFGGQKKASNEDMSAAE